MEAPTTEFQWINIENLTEFRACRNSIQGALLIVDERGEELFLLSKYLSQIAKANVCFGVHNYNNHLPVFI